MAVAALQDFIFRNLFFWERERERREREREWTQKFFKMVSFSFACGLFKQTVPILQQIHVSSHFTDLYQSEWIRYLIVG